MPRRTVATENALIEGAVAKLRELLPRQWEVTRSQEAPSEGMAVEEWLVAQDATGNSEAILLDPRLNPTPAQLQSAYPNITERPGAPVLVVAPYLSPRSRSVLDNATIDYLDLTGNVRVQLDSPALFIRTQGAERDPTPRQRPDRGFSGPTAGRIIRALSDFVPPYTVTELADLARVSAGYASRTLQALEREALVQRDRRGTVLSVDWPAMLRRRGSALTLFDRNRTVSFISRTGARGALESLAKIPTEKYAVTGSFNAVRIRPVAAPVGLTIYTVDPDALAESLNLLPADRGADVQLILPRDEGIFDRASVADGIRWVAPSQLVIDCLGGTGRMSSEGEAVLDWMTENADAWRSQPVTEPA